MKIIELIFYLTSSKWGLFTRPNWDVWMNLTKPWQWRTLIIELDRNWNRQTLTLHSNAELWTVRLTFHFFTFFFFFWKSVSNVLIFKYFKFLSKWHCKFAKLMDNKSYQLFNFFTLFFWLIGYFLGVLIKIRDSMMFNFLNNLVNISMIFK